MATVQVGRQAGPSGNSLPSWIQDFASIMKEWKKQLEDHRTRIEILERGEGNKSQWELKGFGELDGPQRKPGWPQRDLGGLGRGRQKRNKTETNSIPIWPLPKRRRLSSIDSLLVVY